MIRARALARRFGTKAAVGPLDVELEPGGFLLVTGPNGAGKTTFLRLLAGLVAPTSGELQIRAKRGDVGLLAHEPLLYRSLTPLENLDLFGRLYRVGERRERTGMLLERFGLREARAEPVAALSRGMQQRLALCRAFLHRPRLLLLDEPFNALDAGGAALLEGELAELHGDATFVVATHDPERLAALATARLALR